MLALQGQYCLVYWSGVRIHQDDICEVLCMLRKQYINANYSIMRSLSIAYYSNPNLVWKAEN